MWSRPWVLPLIVVSIALLIFTPAPETAQAKGRFDRLIVYGEGTAVEMSTSSLLGFDSFADFSQPVSAPNIVSSEGFWIIRYTLDDASGEFRAFDRLRLIPAANASGSSVYYEGLMSGSSEYDAKWYRGQPGVLNTLTAGVDEARSSNPSGFATGSLLIGGVGVLLGASIALVLERLLHITAGKYSG